MAKPKAGLLPLYLELYDNTSPEVRPQMNGFVDTIADELRELNIDVVAAPVCRLKSEFDSAVSKFEEAGAEAIITLHLAYSPSLECIDALAETYLPIIVLDTTPTFSYSTDKNPNKLMFNHGIHGVQDMCNLLIRRKKDFFIEAGHWEESDVLDRVSNWMTAAHIAYTMKHSRVGLIGEPFKGMGDFAIPFGEMKSSIGIETVIASIEDISKYLPEANDSSVLEEIENDKQVFNVHEVDETAHLNTIRASIAVRNWMKENSLNAFTMNFGSFSGNKSMPTIPFLEASKAMAKGFGYAGEGDVLTAALAGALAANFEETSFTEMFCPDWKNDIILLSHMGEFNHSLAFSKADLINKNMGWLNTGPMVMAVGRFKPGYATIVNLAPGADGKYSLIIAPVEMLDIEDDSNTIESIRGWFQSDIPVDEFLTEYSCIGGTHHSALVYGENSNTIAKFGDIMGWDVIFLD